MPDAKLAARRAAAKWHIDPRIFQSMINQESHFREGVKSGAGAEDIAQFMPATAKAYGVTLGDGHITDDLDGAAHYIADNLKKTGGNYHKALSIYNSGRPDAFRDPSFAGGQTYNYVKNILANAKNFSGGSDHSSGASVSAGGAAAPGATSSFDRAGYDKARKLTILGNYLQEKNPNNPLVKLGVATPGALPDKAEFTTTKTPLTEHITGRGYSGTTAGLIQTLTDRANTLDSKHFNYQWGGGHDKKRPAGSVPVDCSGAVSQVLGACDLRSVPALLRINNGVFGARELSPHQVHC